MSTAQSFDPRETINVAFAEIAIQELGFTEDGPDADTYGLSEKGLEHGGKLLVEKVEEHYISRAEHDRRVTELLETANRYLEETRAHRKDARRFRALLDGGRIRMLGSANVDTGVEGRERGGRPDEWVHFGAEFWSTYPGVPDDPVHRKWGQNALTALADDILRRGSKK